MSEQRGIKNYYYVYGFLFPNKDVEVGIFSTSSSLWEGDTDANISSMTAELCQLKGWDAKKIKSVSFKEVSDDFIKGIAREEGDLLRPGNIRT